MCSGDQKNIVLSFHGSGCVHGTVIVILIAHIYNENPRTNYGIHLKRKTNLVRIADPTLTLMTLRVIHYYWLSVIYTVTVSTSTSC